MERTEFEVRFTELEHLQENGLDGVEFYITTNPGEPLKPLVRVASGGELSRVMLAMKTIFSQTQGITSIVFDEVDTGVSGRVAQAIADKIYQISENSRCCVSRTCHKWRPLPMNIILLKKKLWRVGQKQASEFYLKKSE